MPKAKKFEKTKTTKSRSFYSLHPWRMECFLDRCDLKAYVEASGEFEKVLSVHPTSGASAEALATFILNLVNDNQNDGTLLFDAMAALELVLEDDRLSFSSEQAADTVVTRIKKRMG